MSYQQVRFGTFCFVFHVQSSSIKKLIKLKNGYIISEKNRLNYEEKYG